jgi:hypothetical protein
VSQSRSPGGEPAGTSPELRALDWCCIGAQKAGTSTLFRLLREHPQLFLPPGKEEPIFDRPVEESEVADYLAAHFPPAAVEDRSIGTVTPQYMSSPDTAHRFSAASPGARLVVLLRDPAQRAFSHYRMNVRRGIEKRSFATAVDDQVSALAEGPPADPSDETATYVYRGLYSRILSPWYERYNRDRIAVIFVDELEQDPVGTCHRIHRFLGVDPHTTGHEGLRSHADPPPHRFPGLRERVAAALRKVGLLQLLPGERRDDLAFRIESLLARVAPARHDRVDRASLTRLRRFYDEDRAALEDLIDRRAPW